MINNKTLIVIGAGASKEVNLPTGNELMQIIAHILNIDYDRGYKQVVILLLGSQFELLLD